MPLLVVALQALSALLLGALFALFGCSARALAPVLVPAVQLQARFSLRSSVGRLGRSSQVRAVLLFSEPLSQTPALPLFEATRVLGAAGENGEDGLGMLSDTELRALCALDSLCVAELFARAQARGRSQ